MVDIRKTAGELFGVEGACHEDLTSFSCSFAMQGLLPSFSEIEGLFSYVPERDSMEITFGDKISEITLMSAKDSEKYQPFAKGVHEGDKTDISIVINKSTKDGVHSVWCLEKFLEFLMKEEKTDPNAYLKRWSGIVEDSGGRTAFDVFDETAGFQAGSFIFGNNMTVFDPEKEKRAEKMKRANEACTFMERRTIKLLPGDFEVKTTKPKSEAWRFKDLAKYMRRLDTVMALIYLGASSRIEDEMVKVKEKKGEEEIEEEVKKKAVIFDITRGGREFHILLDDIHENANLTELVAWILSEENAVERAEIARNTVSFLCRDEAQLLDAKDSVVDAAKSSYRLYQRKNVDKYIEVKKKLNESILDAGKKIEQLIGGLFDGFKGNFIAVITALISQVLKGYIDLDKLKDGNPIDAAFSAVISIFVWASLMYLVANLLFIFVKWDYYRRYFDDMHEDFKELLDSAESEKAWEEAKKIRFWASVRLFIFCAILAALWGALLWSVWQVGGRL